MFRLFPAVGPPRLLAIAQSASAIGDGAFYSCSALYFTRIIGLSAGQVGVALTIAWTTGMLAGVPAGVLADQIGPRRTTVMFGLLTAVALSALLVVRSYALFQVAVIGYAICQGGLTSGRQTLLAGLVDAGERTRVRAQLQSTLNAGLAVGAGFGAIALALDTAPAYLGAFALDAVTFLGAALVVRRVPEVPRASVVVSAASEPGHASTAEPDAPTARDARAGQGAPTGRSTKLEVLRDRPYALITFLNAVMYLNMPLLSLGLPLWIATRTDAPTPVAAALLVVNMISVVLFQVRVARRVTGLRGAARSARVAGLLMSAACLVYAGSARHAGALVAVVVLLVGAGIQVVGEMYQGAGAWELGFGLAPAHRQGQYQGFFGMAPQLARTLGPVLLTTLLIRWGTPGWLVLAGLFLAAGLAMGPAVRWATLDRARRAAEPRQRTRTDCPAGCPAPTMEHAST